MGGGGAACIPYRQIPDKATVYGTRKADQDIGGLHVFCMIYDKD